MSCTVTDVVAETDGEGGLVVRWRLEGTGAVNIGMGSTPFGTDHSHVMRVEPTSGLARLTDLPPGRHFVSVSPCAGGVAVVAAERRLRFEGVLNFRDLGGYPTADGKRVRWGQVYRSDGLHQMTTADLLMFESIGIRVVYDLRGSAERSMSPNPVESVVIEVVSQPAGQESPRLVRGSTKLDAEQMLRDVYIGMLANSAPRFGQLFTALAASEGLPAVFHCAAGKDRTGMSAALLLTALGVDRDTVLDDYELTARWRAVDATQDLFRLLVAAGIPEEAVAGLLGTPRWALSNALDVLDETYGGIGAFLRGPAGMDNGSLSDLERRLTT
jgi:protein-tyrosine phosphatase